MAGIVAVAVLLFLSVIGGIVSYRRTLGRGPYAGPTRSAVSIGLLLGLFLGLTVGLLTLLIVLVAKQFA